MGSVCHRAQVPCLASGTAWLVMSWAQVSAAFNFDPFGRWLGFFLRGVESLDNDAAGSQNHL